MRGWRVQCLLDPPEAAWLDYDATCRCEFFSLSKRELLALAEKHLRREQRVKLAEDVLANLHRKARLRLWGMRIANGFVFNGGQNAVAVNTGGNDKGTAPSPISAPALTLPISDKARPHRFWGLTRDAAANAIEIRYLTFAYTALKRETVYTKLSTLAGVEPAQKSVRENLRNGRRASMYGTVHPQEKGGAPAATIGAASHSTAIEELSNKVSELSTQIQDIQQAVRVLAEGQKILIERSAPLPSERKLFRRDRAAPPDSSRRGGADT